MSLHNNSIRVAVAGVGNCASSLVQGVTYYKDTKENEVIPGLMHAKFGPYNISDIEFVAAFDVDKDKVGFDLAEAIWRSKNNTIKFSEPEATGVVVQKAPTLDGLGHYYRQEIEESTARDVDVASVLADVEADVLISYLPVGSEKATEYFAETCLKSRTAFVNAVPVFIASNPKWAKRFEDAGVAVIGDDIKSQLGATISHRVLMRLFETRGIKIDNTYQLNVGGNMDFENMLERQRLESKKISKTQAVTSNISDKLDPENVHIGPSDHVPWLKDRKFAFVRIEGRQFGDIPISLEYKLEVWDSPNSAGVIIDALRAAKIAKDRGLAGPIIEPSAYFFKSPPEQYPDDVGRHLVEEFIKNNS